MTAEIVLSSGDIALIDDAKVTLVTAFKWSPRRCPCTTYAQANLPAINGKRGTITMHRLITEALPGETIDHEDGYGLNNQEYNLRRSSSRHGNNRNARRRKDNTSGYRGVSWHSRWNRWNAGIYINGTRHHLGYFDTAEEAALAYDLTALTFHGEYASVNGIEITGDNTALAIRLLERYQNDRLSSFVRDPRIMRELLGGLK